jgi:hypothetical protein
MTVAEIFMQWELNAKGPSQWSEMALKLTQGICSEKISERRERLALLPWTTMNPSQALSELRRCLRLAWRSRNSFRTLEIARQRIFDSNALYLESLSHSAVQTVLGFGEVYKCL